LPRKIGGLSTYIIQLPEAYQKAHKKVKKGKRGGLEIEDRKGKTPPPAKKWKEMEKEETKIRGNCHTLFGP
jgi:hypothetical protein